MATAAREATSAKTPIPTPTAGADSTAGATVIAELVEADFDTGTAETDAPGFLCKCTDA
jgi:hypothetical protein